MFEKQRSLADATVLESRGQADCRDNLRNVVLRPSIKENTNEVKQSLKNKEWSGLPQHTKTNELETLNINNKKGNKGLSLFAQRKQEVDNWTEKVQAKREALVSKSLDKTSSTSNSTSQYYSSKLFI